MIDIVAVLLVVFHFFLVLGCFLYVYKGKTSIKMEQIVPVVFIPIFGPLLAAAAEYVMLSGRQGIRPINLEPLTLGDDILWVTLKSFHENADIVPLEEAIIINDVKSRRRAVLETLYSDPLKYLDVLNIAIYNDDIETSHYATTTISKAQKDFQLAIQRLAIEVENKPSDCVILDSYIETLEKYIGSGLLESHLLRNLRIVLSKALDRRLEIAGNDRDFIIKKIRNCIHLAEYDVAFTLCDLLIELWPTFEDSWIESIRACVDGNDGFRLTSIVQKMKEYDVDWSNQGKELVRPWLN